MPIFNSPASHKRWLKKVKKAWAAKIESGWVSPKKGTHRDDNHRYVAERLQLLDALVIAPSLSEVVNTPDEQLQSLIISLPPNIMENVNGLHPKDPLAS